MCKCLEHWMIFFFLLTYITVHNFYSPVFPWQRSVKPHSDSHHFPAFFFDVLSINSITRLNKLQCKWHLTKHWRLCKGNLELSGHMQTKNTATGRTPGHDFRSSAERPCQQISNRKPSATVFERESKGMQCWTLWVVKMTRCLSTIFWRADDKLTGLNHFILAVDLRPLQKHSKSATKRTFNAFQI